MEILPLTNDPVQNFDVLLGSEVYNFRIIYNSRGDYWTMDIRDSSENLLVAGIKLVLGVDLVKAYSLNMGSIVAVNMSETQKDPGSGAILGSDVQVYHLSESEIADLKRFAP